MQRQGQLGPDGTPATSAGAVQDRQRRVRQSGRQASRGNPLSRSAEFLRETRGELRKVAWPTRHEVVNSTIIVLIAVVFMTSLIFGYDYLSAKLVLFLFD